MYPTPVTKVSSSTIRKEAVRIQVSEAPFKEFVPLEALMMLDKTLLLVLWPKEKE